MRVVLVLALLLVPTSVDAKAKTTCRDVKTGQYVTQAYAHRYPGLTVCNKAK